MAQQCINAGLCDELQIGIVPRLLVGGFRFFENILLDNVELDLVSRLESPSRIDLRYRLIK